MRMENKLDGRRGRTITKEVRRVTDEEMQETINDYYGDQRRTPQQTQDGLAKFAKYMVKLMGEIQPVIDEEENNMERAARMREASIKTKRGRPKKKGPTAKQLANLKKRWAKKDLTF